MDFETCIFSIRLKCFYVLIMGMSMHELLFGGGGRAQDNLASPETRIFKLTVYSLIYHPRLLFRCMACFNLHVYKP